MKSMDPSTYEVIVSDDSSQAAARDVVESAFPWVRWVAGPGKGPAANRNSGARASRGEWLVFLDDDCEPAPEWLPAMARATSEPGVEVIEGQTICPNPEDSPFVERIENLHGDVFWSCNLALRRNVFEELGGFDEDFTEPGGEDMELAWRLRDSRRQCRFVPAALVRHPARRIGWRKLWWRTFLMRWMLLYRLKTRQSPAVEAGGWKVLGWLLRQQFMELFRSTLHLWTRFQRGTWRTRVFLQAWKWITFPALLPYLVLWEFRFRRLLRSRRAVAQTF